MATVRAQVILRSADSIPENYVTNSWAFTGSDVPGVITGITAALKGFYDYITSTILTSLTAQNGHSVKYYNLPGVKPNYPFSEAVWNLGSAPSSTPLPAEVALCMSFQGQRAAGFPQARRRGRIYIGPCNQANNSSGRPSAGTISTLTTAGANFKAAISALTGDTVWSVWSDRDQTGVEVTDGWVDNSWDTQRRRGYDSTSRTTFV